MADPGFPRRGEAPTPEGAPTYYLTNFHRKLHENKEILVRGGGTRVPHAPLDLPLTELCSTETGFFWFNQNETMHVFICAFTLSSAST